MNESEDLFSPLLQLNPPVLVRTRGSPGAIDLAALRRAAANGGTSSPSHAHARSTEAAAVATTTTRNGTTPVISLAARKLHDAKSAARQVSRMGEAPSRAHTTVILGQRRGSTSIQRQPLPKTAGTIVSHRTADQPSYGSAGSAPPSPSAAPQPPPPPSYTRGAAVSNEDVDSAPLITAAAAAATASAEEQGLAPNLPYLMRHTQDTGALLDTLFPLQFQQQMGGSSTGGAGESTSEALVAVQTVSAAPASREAVMALHAALRARLEARRARPTGLCSIRRSIYADLFSELVRQVTVEEPARGLLLARVRENDEHALHVHAALLREGESFAASKLLQDTQSTTALLGRLSELQTEKTQLEVRRHNLQNVRQELERRFEEQRQIRHAQQQDELNYLRRANQQLSLRLKIETERASAGGGAGGAEVSSAATEDNKAGVNSNTATTVP